MTSSRNTVLDFARRTKSNLEEIQQLQAEEQKLGSKPKYFEVTQLINSCIGLVIFPYEKAFDYLPEVSLDQIPIYQEVLILHSVKKNEPKTLKQLIKKMRNSFAHQNMCFKNYNNQIVGVHLWGYSGLNTGKKSPPDWVVYLKIDVLEKLVAEIVKYFERIDKDLSSNEEDLISIGRVLGIEDISLTNPSSFL